MHENIPVIYTGGAGFLPSTVCIIITWIVWVCLFVFFFFYDVLIGSQRFDVNNIESPHGLTPIDKLCFKQTIFRRVSKYVKKKQVQNESDHSISKLKPCIPKHVQSTLFPSTKTHLFSSLEVTHNCDPSHVEASRTASLCQLSWEENWYQKFHGAVRIRWKKRTLHENLWLKGIKWDKPTNYLQYQLKSGVQLSVVRTNRQYCKNWKDSVTFDKILYPVIETSHYGSMVLVYLSTFSEF